MESRPTIFHKAVDESKCQVAGECPGGHRNGIGHASRKTKKSCERSQADRFIDDHDGRSTIPDADKHGYC